MNTKTVLLKINCFNLPYRLTITDGNCNKLLYRATIGSKSIKIKICTKSRELKLKIEKGRQTIYETICLTGAKCQEIVKRIEFNRIGNQERYNIITLTDAQYGFPISRAIINFRN